MPPASSACEPAVRFAAALAALARSAGRLSPPCACASSMKRANGASPICPCSGLTTPSPAAGSAASTRRQNPRVLARSDDPHPLALQVKRGARCMIVTMMGEGDIWRQKCRQSRRRGDAGAVQRLAPRQALASDHVPSLPQVACMLAVRPATPSRARSPCLAVADVPTFSHL